MNSLREWHSTGTGVCCNLHYSPNMDLEVKIYDKLLLLLVVVIFFNIMEYVNHFDPSF